MKKIVYILLVIWLFFPVIAFTQSTVTKVFYYDSDWKKIESRENASYSRIISFDTADYNFEHPIGWVKDYYRPSGNLQWKGKFSYYDIENEDNNKNRGLTTWYFDNSGRSKSRESYYYNGKLE